MNVLWLSRHEPTGNQRAELSATFGAVEIVQRAETVISAQQVRLLMEEADAQEVVAVLPLNLMADLTALGIRPIRAVMQRITGEEGQVTFEHLQFERVVRVILETEALRCDD